VTLQVVATLSASCPDLEVDINVALNWVNSLIGGICHPHCPSSGTVPAALDCLTTLSILADSVSNIVVMAPDAQIAFCR